MFDFIRRLLGKGVPRDGAPQTNPLPKIEQQSGGIDHLLPEVNSAEARAADSPQEHSFVCREPVIGRDERIAGYEFILPEHVQMRLQAGDDTEALHKAYDDALLHSLSSLGGDALLGSRLAFVRLSPGSLDNPRIAQLPARNTVLVFSPTCHALDLETLKPKLAALREKGFSCAWYLQQDPSQLTPDLLELAACADYVQFETAGLDSAQIKSLLRPLLEARPAALPGLKLMGAGIASYDEFRLIFQGSFDYFLGSFVNSRENWLPPKRSTNRLNVIELLNMLRSGAEFKQIAEKMKLDPVLTFKLLRYLNSPVMGLQMPVTSIERGLIVLGRDQFFRWLSLFLFDIHAPGYRDRVLTEQALARAYFLESLSGQGAFSTNKDQLFILGLFSLLDLLMGQAMSVVLQQAKPSEPVQQALLGESGNLRDALELAIAIEGLSPENIEARATKCGVDALLILRSANEALEWANKISLLADD
ncbi:MAG: HDOD domain-containing protein [Betaproteobacteria bacterium]